LLRGFLIELNQTCEGLSTWSDWESIGNVLGITMSITYNESLKLGYAYFAGTLTAGKEITSNSVGYGFTGTLDSKLIPDRNITIPMFCPNNNNYMSFTYYPKNSVFTNFHIVSHVTMTTVAEYVSQGFIYRLA
jgi:hypothetical protein